MYEESQESLKNLREAHNKKKEELVDLENQFVSLQTQYMEHKQMVNNFLCATKVYLQFCCLDDVRKRGLGEASQDIDNGRKQASSPSKCLSITQETLNFDDKRSQR